MRGLLMIVYSRILFPLLMDFSSLFYSGCWFTSNLTVLTWWNTRKACPWVGEDTLKRQWLIASLLQIVLTRFISLSDLPSPATTQSCALPVNNASLITTLERFTFPCQHSFNVFRNNGVNTCYLVMRHILCFNCFLCFASAQPLSTCTFDYASLEDNHQPSLSSFIFTDGSPYTVTTLYTCCIQHRQRKIASCATCFAQVMNPA